jgi:hypothetical protein
MQQSGETRRSRRSPRMRRRGGLLATAMLLQTARALAQHAYPGGAARAPEPPAQQMASAAPAAMFRALACARTQSPPGFGVGAPPVSCGR